MEDLKPAKTKAEYIRTAAAIAQLAITSLTLIILIYVNFLD